MLALTLLLLSATPPAPVGVSLASSVKLGPQDSERVLVSLDAALRAAGLEPRRVLTQCQGERDCLAKRAKADGLAAIVSVALAGSRRGLAVDLDAISSSGASLAQSTAHFASAQAPELDGALEALSAQLAKSLAPAAGDSKPPVADAPVETLTPIAPEAPLVITPAPLPSRGPPRWSVIACTAIAVVSAGTAAAFGISALAAANEAHRESAPGLAANTERRSLQLIDQANSNLSVTLGLGITSAVFTAFALALGLARLFG